MKALSYKFGSMEEIEIGKEYNFGELWDGDGDGTGLLASGTIVVFADKINEEEEWEYVTVNFKVQDNKFFELLAKLEDPQTDFNCWEDLEEEYELDIAEIIVKVTDLYQ